MNTPLMINRMGKIRDNLLDFNASLASSVTYLDRIAIELSSEHDLLDQFFKLKHGADYMDTVEGIWTKRANAFSEHNFKPYNLIFGLMYVDVIRDRNRGHEICPIDFRHCAYPTISSEEMINILNAACDEFHYSENPMFKSNVLVPALAKLFMFFQYNGPSESEMYYIEDRFLSNRKIEIQSRDEICKQALLFKGKSPTFVMDLKESILHKASMSVGSLLGDYELFCLGLCNYSDYSYIIKVCPPKSKISFFDCSKEDQEAYANKVAPLGAEVSFEKQPSSGHTNMVMKFKDFCGFANVL